MRQLTLNKKTAPALLLRLGLAIVFGYAAVSSFLHPQEWIGYLPSILTSHISSTILLHVFSAYELLLVLALIVGLYVRYVALLCALTLTGIVVSNFNLFIISFRDIALICGALALAFLADSD